MTKSFLARLGAFGLLLSSSPFLQAEESITLYTQRHYGFDEKIHEQFEAKTGIKVNVVKAGADELIARLEEEGERTPADLFMTADAGTLTRAKEAGVLGSFSSSELTAGVPDFLKDADGAWTAMTYRARVIMYAHDRVKPEELSTYEALADDKWRARILIRSSSNVYNQSLMTTIIEANGAEAALDWAKAVRKNMARPPQGSDRDQIRSVAKGLGDIAVANTYYLGLLETSEEETDRKAAAAVKVFFPNKEGRGSHVNISGVGVVGVSKKKELAEKFVAFLLSPEVQAQFPENTFEYPAVESIELSEQQKRWGELEADQVPLSTLGKRNSEAVRLFNEAGWE